MANQSIIKHISDYIRFLNDHNIRIDEAFLYGSYSRDDHSTGSDIDVLVVSRELDEFNDQLIGKIWRLNKQFDEKIEPLVVSKKKFLKDDVSPIFITIKKEGVQIS